MKRNNGITLIALVITIIVLIILAGVAINLTLGENGILTKAQNAKEDYNLAREREQLELAIVDIQTQIMTNEQRTATLNDLYEKIDKNKYSIELSFEPLASNEGVNTKPTFAIVNKIGTDYYFTVDVNLKITDVEIKVSDEDSEEESDNKNYLYNLGRVSEEADEFVGVSDTNAEYVINSDNIYINVIGEWNNFTYVGTKNKIDLQNYSKICCLVTTGTTAQGAGNYFQLAINDVQLPTSLDAAYIKQLSSTVPVNQTNYVLEWAIPETYKNDNNYIGFISTIKDVYVYKIWLED